MEVQGFLFVLYLEEIFVTCCIVVSPPSPGSPYTIDRGSTWVTLGWYELSCDGGHRITELIIRYQKEVSDFYVSSYSYVYGLDPSRRNYTIHNLEPETPYKFSVQALSAEFQASSFSEERVISTLILGMYACVYVGMCIGM